MQWQSVLDDTGSATENEGDEEDDLDLNSDVVAALLDGNSEDGHDNDDDNDSWEDLDIQEENLWCNWNKTVLLSYLKK